MTNFYLPKLKHLKTILLLITVFFAATGISFGQVNKSYRVSFRDSLEADQNTTFLYNNLVFSNLTATPLTLNAAVAVPTGWKTISANASMIVVPAGGTANLPLTIAKKTNSPAQWQTLTVTLQDGQKTDQVKIYLKAEALSNYTVKTNPIVFDNAARKLEASMVVRNTGNIAGDYQVRMTDEASGLNITDKIKLQPGKDSLYTVSYSVPKALWEKMNQSKLRLEVTDLNFIKKKKAEYSRLIPTASDGNNNPFITNIDLARTYSSFDKHPSAYTLIKTDFETGYIRNSSAGTYFFALSGEAPLSKSSTLSASYRSRQYGVYNILDRDVFDITYRSKKFFVHAGQTTDSKYFFSYGTGLSAGYTWKPGNSITLSTVIHTPGFFTPSDNYGMNLVYKVKNFYFNHDVVYNSNLSNGDKSYIGSTEVIYRKKQNLDFGASLGIAGINNDKLTKQSTAGQSYGYSVNYRGKNLSFSSRASVFDKNYAGFNRNHQTIDGSVRYKLGKSSLETMFHFDQRQNNYFTDTLYNSNLLSINVKQYGLRYNYFKGSSSVSAGTGIIQQNSDQGSLPGPQYKYAELMYYFRSKKNFVFSLSSTTAFATVSEKPVYFSVSNINTAYKFIGISGGFSNVPVFASDAGKKTFTGNQQTLYGGPYVSLVIKKMISFGAQYNFSKTLYDNKANQYMSFNLNYNNKKAGIQLGVNGYAPLQNAYAGAGNPLRNGFLNISFKKRLFVPFVFRKKYHELKARFFEDTNGNNIMDKGEHAIEGAAVGLNDLNFVTDKNGNLLYRNVEKGTYSLDLSKTNVYGYLPATGNDLDVNVKKDTRVDIPFKKSRTITGMITMVHDTNSKINYYPDNIKLIASETGGSGKVFFATTDKEGKFFFTLPAGIYTVELSAQATGDQWRAEVASFTVNLLSEETGVCNFVITQRKREIKIMKINKNVSLDKNAIDKSKEVKQPDEKDIKRWKSAEKE